MCIYCEQGKGICNNRKELGIELHSGTSELVAYGLDNNNWDISVKCKINFCPMCGKKLRKENMVAIKTKQRVKGLKPRKPKKPLKGKIDNHPNQSIDLKDLPIHKSKRTLEEVQREYRNQNRKCEYCEFCSREISFEDWGGVIVDFDVLWCHVKDEECDNKPCEFYQVKGE